jgi:NADH-quinone oxidoreductase subunit F
VAIRTLKRHATDHDTGLWKEKIEIAPANGKRVAVAGSGPAGLTASHYLARLGYSVTVFEAMPEPGGMMRYGIPDFRLPKDLVEDEIDYIKELGVDIKTNTSIVDGQSLINLKDSQGYDAVFVATGASVSQKMDVEGIGLDGVRPATELMKKVNQGGNISFKGQKVVVMGGGNVAVDTAMTVLRLGAREVRMVCLESRDEMPAHDLEICRMLAEGVVLQNSLGLKQINGKDGKVIGLELMSCRSVYDDQGNFCPCYDETATTSFEADALILAIGQKADTSLLNGSGIMFSDGRIVSDEDTLETKIPGIFAGGDAVTGPDSVIEAIAAGRKAAAAIDRYLGGSGNIDDELSKPVKRKTPQTQVDVDRSRVCIDELKPEERIKSFEEIELPLDGQAAVNEARRCFECDPVTVQKCDMCIDRLEIGELPMCVSTCPNRALDFGPLSELIEKYGGNRDIEDMPDSQDTKPAVIFKSHRPKQRLVPYDSEKAVKLFMRRDPLPPVFTSIEDVIEIPEGMVGRNELVVKHKTANDLMKHTRNDES